MTDEELIGGANDKQVAGTHYKKYTIQPWDAIVDWQLGFLDGCAVKYISRWKDKGGVEDIKKAIHFLEKLLETQMDSKLRLKQLELQSEIHKAKSEVSAPTKFGGFFPCSPKELWKGSQ